MNEQSNNALEQPLGQRGLQQIDCELDMIGNTTPQTDVRRISSLKFLRCINAAKVRVPNRAYDLWKAFCDEKR
jgi:hypothetical protein